MRAPIAARIAAWAPIVLTPRIAEACAVCSAGRDDETRLAFLLTTIFLSLLPLCLVGAIAWWLRRRVRALETEEAVAAAPGTARVASPSRS